MQQENSCSTTLFRTLKYHISLMHTSTSVNSSICLVLIMWNCEYIMRYRTTYTSVSQSSDHVAESWQTLVDVLGFIQHGTFSSRLTHLQWNATCKTIRINYYITEYAASHSRSVLRHKDKTMDNSNNGTWQTTIYNNSNVKFAELHTEHYITILLFTYQFCQFPIKLYYYCYEYIQTVYIWPMLLE